jgi:hypothetical protein
MEFAMATTLIPLGPDFQININSGANNGISGNQDLADVALLPDGRFVVVYQSEYFGDSADTDPIFAIFNENGSTSLAYSDVFNAGTHQRVPAVAASSTGGFGVVFQNDRHANNTADANGPNITYVPVSATGAIGSRIAVGDFDAGAGHDALQNAAIATLAGGRQVVAFERIWTAGTDHDVFLNVVNAAGTATQFSVANPLEVVGNASWQANPSVAAIGNEALVVFEDGSGTTTASANIRGRIFNGDTNSLGAAFTIADHAARLRTADVAAIDDHRYAITYGDQNDIWARIYDETTGVLSPEVQVDVAGGFALDPAVTRLPGNRFVVTWAEFNGANYDVRARLFDSAGAAMGSNFVVTSLTDASQFTPDVAVSGHQVLFTWTDFGARPEDNSPVGIRGRMFNVNDPPSDFNGDGLNDILWQNANGTPAVWLLNGTNLLSYGPPIVNPGAAWHENAAADFNGDGKVDILFQNDNGTPAVWLMNGTGVLSFGPQLANPGPSWHEKAAADFNDDGKADILWQNDNGPAAVWLMNGANVASFGPALPDPGPTWHANEAADFNGDGKADILWQNDNGTPAVWLMDGTNLVSFGAPIINPGAAWHEKAAADFNGDGKADILFQNDNGAAAVWLMDGTTILSMGPALPNPGTAWHVKQAYDANGDAKADILWQNDNGTPAVWLMNGTNFVSFGAPQANPGADWHIV